MRSPSSSNSRNLDPATNAPARPATAKADHQKQQFRAMIEPLVYRARQLGLSRVQIREIITSLL